MNKINTINQNKDFKRAYFKGKYRASSVLVTYMLKNNGISDKKNDIRIGITTSKKIGNAVKRNRCRRLIKAAFAQLYKQGALRPGYDYVFVARTDTSNCKMDEIKNIMHKHIGSILK